jgi:hypothetical protein
VCASIPEPDIFTHDEGEDANQARATAALHAAFDRLSPQGSDAWNFLAAFTHLGDRYGPYQPGASALSKVLDRASSASSASSAVPSGSGPLGRLNRLRGGSGQRSADGAPTELEEAMAQVVEAFRFLSSRVQSLEERVARQDHPIEGAAWLVPAPELGALVETVATHLAAATPDGLVVHADCGDGALLGVLRNIGIGAEGVEPRGALALRALERGCSVALCELGEYLAGRADATLGGLVLSGLVDRLALHALVLLVAQSRRVLGHGAPLVVVVADADTGATTWDSAGRDLIDGRPLALATWQVLLERAGFVDVHPLSVAGADGRTVITASAPA